MVQSLRPQTLCLVSILKTLTAQQQGDSVLYAISQPFARKIDTSRLIKISEN